MGPENPNQENKFSKMTENISASTRRTEILAKAAEVIGSGTEAKYETPALLMSLARTKAHKDFEHVDDILERGTLINQRKLEINQFEIVPDDTLRNLSRVDGKEEITVSEFKKRYL